MQLRASGLEAIPYLVHQTQVFRSIVSSSSRYWQRRLRNGRVKYAPLPAAHAFAERQKSSAKPTKQLFSFGNSIQMRTATTCGGLPR